MYHNYFYLKRLAQKLDELLVGYQLVECFSQNKDELIFGFASQNHQIYLIANLSSHFGLIEIKEDYARAKRNSVDLFKALIGSSIVEVQIFTNERSFYITLSTGQKIIFKMHGSRSNILIAKNHEVEEVFRHNLPKDQSISIEELDNHLDLTFDHFKAVDGDLQKFNPTLGKEVRSALLEEGYDTTDVTTRWSMYNAMNQLLQDASLKIYLDNNEKPYLSFWEHQDQLKIDSLDVIQVNNSFYQLSTYFLHIKSFQNKLVNEIDKEIKKTKSYLEKSESKLDELITRRSYEEIANIIMANLHNIPSRSKETVLEDLYKGDNDTISIKLNPDLTPQKNAENYYRKYKNQKIEFDKLEDNISSREKVLKELMARKVAIQSSEDYKSLKSFIKKEGQSSTKATNLPYKKVEFAGYEILIGRNSKANDELTLKVAKKDDLWLHAKDVSGSHVVIRQIPGKNFPKNVIEYAARLAASHSKRKTDSLCPVIYTPKKYVRKRKGDPAGAVVVEREEVLMAEPLHL